MVNVYGVDLPKNAAADGKKFMSAQFACCGFAFCMRIVFLIVALLTHSKFTSIITQFNSLNNATNTSGTAVTVTLPPGLDQLEKFKITSAWISEVIALGLLAIGGLLFVWVARKLMGDGNLKPCCFLEGCCAVFMCCSGIGYCAGFGFMFSLSALLSAANTKSCTGMAQGKCTEAFTAAKSLIMIMTIYLGLTACYYCTEAAICGAGSKFANDTQDEIDDAELAADYE